MRIDPEGQIIAAKFPNLVDDRLENGRNTDSLVDARADVADADLERRIFSIGAHVPPDFGAVGYRLRAYEQIHKTLELGHRVKLARDAGTREVAEDDAAVRHQPGLTPHPERRAIREAHHVR